MRPSPCILRGGGFQLLQEPWLYFQSPAAAGQVWCLVLTSSWQWDVFLLLPPGVEGPPSAAELRGHSAELGWPETGRAPLVPAT